MIELFDIFKGQRPQVEEREINARMDTTLVRTVLDIGVEREVVKRAIRNRLLDKGITTELPYSFQIFSNLFRVN